MPKIFDDLSAFQAWFNPVASRGDGPGLGGDQSAQLITSLHAILKPFLLRRLKVDVEVNLPPKKEYILYAPLTQQQVELYQAVIAGGVKLREWIVKKLCGTTELDSKTLEALQDKKGAVETAIEEIEDVGIAEAIAKRRPRRKAVKYEEKEEDDSFDDSDDDEERPTRKQTPQEMDANEIGRDYAIKKACELLSLTSAPVIDLGNSPHREQHASSEQDDPAPQSLLASLPLQLAERPQNRSTCRLR